MRPDVSPYDTCLRLVQNYSQSLPIVVVVDISRLNETAVAPLHERYS